MSAESNSDQGAFIPTELPSLEGAGLDRPLPTIGGFEIVERLRDGGMASLYLGRRSGARGFSRPVAIKVVHPHLTSRPELLQMFVDEALLGSHLSHPNIVHVEEFGEDAGQYFLVMEYIDGCSVSELRRHMRKSEKVVDPVVAAFIGAEAARGLHHAHEATDADGRSLGVVHRDVTPGNILLSRAGHVKVIDFGIAKSGFRREHTVDSLKGKFRYMSPEQASGKALDRRSDIYSLGLVLWELLTMRRAISADAELALLERGAQPGARLAGRAQRHR